MQTFSLPAGSRIMLTASSLPATTPTHRWGVEIHDAPRIEGAGARLTFGSHIGGLDKAQRIDIPEQNIDCVVSVWSSHETAQGWVQTASHVANDTPDDLTIDFNDDKATAPDCSLAFHFQTPRRAA